ncbi:MAG: hypothetical protein WC100_02855 [Sterolibacterium sp.]
MKNRSICLAPGRLKPGMLTAAPILVRQGEELLPANCTLDDAMIDSIRRRAIHCVRVNVSDERDQAEIARDIATEEKRLNYIFRGESSEARAELLKAMCQFRTWQLQ